MNKKIIYTCGPTIYSSRLHLGNLRSIIWANLIRCCLEWEGHEVIFNMNLTDIDDKILNAMEDEDLISFISRTCSDTLTFLNKHKIIRAKDNILLATDYVPEMLSIIHELEKINKIQVVENEILFKSSFKGFKNNIRREGIKTIDRQMPSEQVLWKRNLEFPEVFWRTKWFDGRPGWHIECSSMIKHVLEQNNVRTLDFQIGGYDLKFPHHFNSEEILTTLNFNIKKTLHIGLLTNKKKKMSKSLGNTEFLNTEDIKLMKFFFATQSYNKNQEFSEYILKQNKSKYNKFCKIINELSNEINNNYEQINSFIQNFNISGIIGLIFAKKINKTESLKIANFFDLI